jgi:hypothetical protein
MVQLRERKSVTFVVNREEIVVKEKGERETERQVSSRLKCLVPITR